ncbi:uncharacterized protein [Diadema antillarum]|uniref:uncharacterized protein n=1 Tax=Diadema antillarum TaxID=105358 RepID=UPI003A865CE8
MYLDSYDVGQRGMAVVTQPPTSSHVNPNASVAYTTSDQAALIEDQLTSSGNHGTQPPWGHHPAGQRANGSRRLGGSRIGSRRGIHKYREPEIRPWSSGLFSCCQDPEICMTGLLCSPCLASRLAERVGENPLISCLPFGCAALRTKLRTQHRIQGDICTDYGVTCCCGGPLALCQMWRELDYIEKKNAANGGTRSGLVPR